MKLKLFFRQISCQKTAWILNIICLSVAFAVLFIVVKQVKYDFSFNNCFPDAERVYQLGYYDSAAGKYKSSISIPVIREAMEPIPEISSYTILWRSTNEKTTFYCGEAEYAGVPYYGVRPGFIDVFCPRILAGDAGEALETRSGLVIPQSLAKKWFGSQDAVGKSVGFGSKENLWLVKAVYEDFPENSSMRNAVLLKMNSDNENDRSEWSYFCFCRGQQGIDREKLEKKIVQTFDSLSASAGNENRFSSYYLFKLKPVGEIYFSPFSEGLFGKNGNLALTLCLLVVGILIIAVAYINFINFSTALAPGRIGTFNLCKISGASPGVLRRNVVGEAVFLSFIAWLISFFWVWGFSGQPLAKAYFSASLHPVDSIALFLMIGVGALLVGALAGIYPAFYMTSFPSALVLKGTFALSSSGRRLRNGLLVFQFVVTMVLLIISFFIVIQRHYMMDLPWGYQKENIVYTWTNRSIEQSPALFRSELLKNPNILDVTASRFIPGYVPMGWGRSFLDTLQVQFYAWPVSPNFLSFFGIPLYEGDTLRQPPAGKDYAVFNRRMVEKFGLRESVGKEVFGAFDNPVTVVGFAENVNFASLHHEIEPMAFICGDDMWNDFIFVKLRPERIHETVGYLKDCFAKFGSEDCEFTFLDDYTNNLYRQEESLSLLISVFCLITVIISLAGIYGLLVFNIRYKVKEVGIRKINGATGGQILWMLNRIFIRLVFLGFIIAVPVSALLVNGWLDSYPYRTPVYWWVFAISLLLTLAITLVTVGYQSWKAASANPVESIKTE